MPPAGKSILVVQDDRALREELASRISALGVDVRQARDAFEGLECLATGSLPSAILLDLWRPRTGGKRFLDALRDEPAFADIPVVTMSEAAELHAEPPLEPVESVELPDPAEPDAPPLVDHAKSVDVQELAHLLVSLCEA